MVYLFHYYLYQILPKVYFGLNFEYLKIGDDQYLILGPMLKYFIKENFKVSFAPRAKTDFTRTGLFWDNLYMGLSYDFTF